VAIEGWCLAHWLIVKRKRRVAKKRIEDASDGLCGEGRWAEV
jgi:hypothetical protein